MNTTVVTGAAGALGSALVRHLVASGHKVAGLDAPPAGERLAALAAELGPSFFGHAMDVRSRDAWASALPLVEERVGAPTGAVLVAGGWRGGVPFHAEPDESVFAAMLSSNLETAERSLHALLPGLVARSRGSVVVIGSRAAVSPWTSAGAAAYAASKAGVVALAQAIAAEVTPHGVRVNAVLPSVIDTPANRGAMPGADPSKWVSPESIAKVIAFLLSDDARDVSGAALPVYGRS